MTRLHATPDSLNGTHDAAPRPRKTKSARTPSARPTSRRGLRHARRLALLVGGIGTSVLALSVVHCTESISLLTGSHWLLAGLLAVGIDAGMVASELAEVASHGTRAELRVKPWARGYTIAAVALSVLLNAYAFGLHAAGGMVWAAWLLGAAVPCLVYALGRVGGYLWAAGE